MKYLKNFLDQLDFLCALQQLNSLNESVLIQVADCFL